MICASSNQESLQLTWPGMEKNKQTSGGLEDNVMLSVLQEIVNGPYSHQLSWCWSRYLFCDLHHPTQSYSVYEPTNSFFPYFFFVIWFLFILPHDQITRHIFHSDHSFFISIHIHSVDSSLILSLVLQHKLSKDSIRAELGLFLCFWHPHLLSTRIPSNELGRNMPYTQLVLFPVTNNH